MQDNTRWPTRKFTCPYCHAISAFDCLFSVRGRFENNYYPFSVWSCHNCDRAIFLQHPHNVNEHNAATNPAASSVFPSTEPSVDTRVPTAIAGDFVEASKDYNIGSYKSAAVMARRTIQKMCLDLGATPKNKLWEQIDELKTNGRLHPDLAEIATEIRLLGNDGAHPADDGLDEIGEEDAKEILNFTAELLDDLYVRPQKVAAMKKKRADQEAGK